MMVRMGDREARRQAAREAVLQARLEAERPWWQKRFIAWFFSAPLRLWRWLRWWGRELRDDTYEVLQAWVAVGFTTVVGVLVAWGWETAPVPTAVLVLGAVVFLAFGGVEFFRERRRGRLTMIAIAAFGFVALWVVVPVLGLAHYLLV